MTGVFSRPLEAAAVTAAAAASAAAATLGAAAAAATAAGDDERDPLPAAAGGSHGIRGGLVCEWALVFQLAEDEAREASWRLRSGPQQIEFVDEVLATAARARGKFPRQCLDLKIHETWLEFRVAVLNGLLELLTSPHCRFRCELFRSASGGWDSKSVSLLVLVHLPETAALDHCEHLEYQLPLHPDVARELQLPVPAQTGKRPAYPPGHMRLDRSLAGHFQDVHGKPLYLPHAGVGGSATFGMMDRVRLMSEVVDEHVDLEDLIARGIVSGHFPLHSAELAALAKQWARACLVFSLRQPLQQIQGYFGSQTAFYFAWLGFQARALTPLAIMGVAVELWFDWYRSTWARAIHSACGAMVVLWASVYLRLWARREASLRLEWDSSSGDSQGRRRPNPNYRGVWTSDPVTGAMRRKCPARKQRLLRLASRSVTVVFVAFSALLVFSIFQLKAEMELRGVPHASLVAASLNAVQIKVLEIFWSYVSTWLVEVENYRTLAKRQDALIWKVFLFRALNAFSASFWISYGKQRCEEDDCIAELRFQLASVFATYNAITIWTDVALPFVRYRLQTLREDGIWSSSSANRPVWRRRSSVERQAMMKDYDWRASVDDYMTVALQSGLVLLFFSVLPAIAMLAVLSHLIQIRADACKLCYTHRRPFPDDAAGAGAWNDVMDLLARLAMVNNAALVIFTSGLLDERTQAERWLLLLLSERAAALLMQVVNGLIPLTPRRVKITRKRREVVAERLQEERVGCARCAQSGGHAPWPRRRPAARGATAEGDEASQDCGSCADSVVEAPVKVPRYELGRDPRTLMDALLAPHLQVAEVAPLPAAVAPLSAVDAATAAASSALQLQASDEAAAGGSASLAGAPPQRQLHFCGWMLAMLRRRCWQVCSSICCCCCRRSGDAPGRLQTGGRELAAVCPVVSAGAVAAKGDSGDPRLNRPAPWQPAALPGGLGASGRGGKKGGKQRSPAYFAV